MKKHLLTDAEAVDVEIADAALRASEIRQHLGSVTNRLAARITSRGLNLEKSLVMAELMVNQCSSSIEAQLQERYHPLEVPKIMVKIFRDTAPQFIDACEQILDAQFRAEREKQKELEDIARMLK